MSLHESSILGFTRPCVRHRAARPTAFKPQSTLHRGEEREWGYFGCPIGKKEDSECPSKGLAFPREATPHGTGGGVQYRTELPCTSDCYPSVGKQREKTKQYSRLTDKETGKKIEVPAAHRALAGSIEKGVHPRQVGETCVLEAGILSITIYIMHLYEGWAEVLFIRSGLFLLSD
jgi:hypothetical protein